MRVLSRAPVRAAIWLMAGSIGIGPIQADPPPPSAEQIQAVAAASPAVDRGHWGAVFQRLETGEVLFSRNAGMLFLPASNAKLLSSAAVLAKLGPGYRFRTRLLTETAPDASGTVSSDLILVGGGDPTLGGIAVPYRLSDRGSDRLGPLAALVESAWQSGLRRVGGDIVGDDTRYPWIPFAEGWAQDDTMFGYGTPVSALSIHDSLFELRIAPVATGQTARIDIDPPLPYFTFDNRVRTVAKGERAKIYIDRRPGSRHVEVWGTVAMGRTRSYEIAVDDPAAYAAFALRHLLIQRGIEVRGGFRARHRLAGRAPEVEPQGFAVTRESPPLSQVLEVLNKVSQNLWAEIALREAVRASGLDEANPISLIAEFLETLGLAESGYRLQDASGLSRLSLVSPSALVRVLGHMAAQPEPGAWMGLMPVAGRDGTLEKRFRKKGRGRIYAKTGTLTGTGALSGYAASGDGETIVFSVLVNNVNAPASEIREFIDSLVELFVP